MAKIYEHGDYYLKMNRTHPKAGLPIVNKHTDDSPFSIYPYTDNKSLYLTKSPYDSKKTYTPLSYEEQKEQLNQILILVRKHAIENNKNLILDYDLANYYDIQNFVVHGQSDGNDYKVVPVTNDEIEKINESGTIVNVKLPHHVGHEHYIKDRNKTITEDSFEKILWFYAVSTGKINLDINAIEPSQRHLNINKKGCDFSNIVSITNSGKIDNTMINFPALVTNGKETECIYTMPQHIDENINAQIGVLSVPIEFKDNTRAAWVSVVPKEFHNTSKNISFGLYGAALKSGVKFAEQISQQSFNENDKEIKILDNLINLYSEHSYLLKEEDGDKENFEQLKNIRIGMNIKCDTEPRND